MKTIILVSSIFYLLGVKVSNKVDLMKKAEIKPVVTNKIDIPEIPGTNCRFLEAAKQIETNVPRDSVKITEVTPVPKTTYKEKM